MGKKLILLFGLIMAVVSCSNSDDDIYFYETSPVLLKIDIQNAAGANLLNPEIEGHMFGDSTVVAEYEGQAYPANWDYEGYKSRAIIAIFRGLFCDAPYNTSVDGKPQKSNKNTLYFGDLEGTESFDKTIVLKYPGHSHEIRVVNQYIVKKGVPNKTTTVYIDGILNEAGENIILKK